MVGRVREEKRRDERRREEKRREETRRDEKRREEKRRDETRREEKRRDGKGREEKRSEAKLSEEKRREEKRREEKRREAKGSQAERKEEKRREAKQSEKKRSEQKRSEEKRREEKRKRKRTRKRKRKSQKKEDQRRERVRRKKMQAGEKVEKSRKVGSLKRRVRSHLAKWEMNNCAPLWREAHRSQNVQNTPFSVHFWKLRCRKNAQLRRKSDFQVKMYRTPFSEHFWKLRCWKSARRCGAKHMSKSKVLKKWRSRTTFGRSDAVSCGRGKGFCTLPKVSKTWWFCSSFKNVGRRETFEEDLQRCISRGRRSTRDMFIRDVRRSGRWFPEMGCILVHQIVKFAQMILRDWCGTSYDLASFFCGRRNTYFR